MKTKLTQTIILRYSRRDDALTLTVLPREKADENSLVRFHGIKSATRELPELVERVSKTCQDCGAPMRLTCDERNEWSCYPCLDGRKSN